MAKKKRKKKVPKTTSASSEQEYSELAARASKILINARKRQVEAGQALNEFYSQLDRIVETNLKAGGRLTLEYRTRSKLIGSVTLEGSANVISEVIRDVPKIKMSLPSADDPTPIPIYVPVGPVVCVGVFNCPPIAQNPATGKTCILIGCFVDVTINGGTGKRPTVCVYLCPGFI